ncbi:MAG: hypothetical protein GY861_19635 [bacterium]|nr:hypothetical protein [bacterium]
MNDVVHADILNVLRECRKILKNGDALRLRELSNHTIHNASIFQDEDSLSIAVVVYSISKILERNGIDKEKIASMFLKASFFLEKNDEKGYRKVTKDILKFISRKDSKLRIYIEEVVRQAEIKKGTGLFAHGISVAQASFLLGISQWELMNYIGKTRITDEFPEGMNVQKRLDFARGIFK